MTNISPLLRFISLFLLCFSSFPGVAQLSFVRYEMANGLASNDVRSIVQDKAGYLWIASTAGLQRWDGHRFKTFRHQPGNPHSVPPNVYQLLIDGNQQLWLMNDLGEAGRFDRGRLVFIPSRVEMPHKDAPFNEKELVTDKTGNIFMVLKGYGLLQYQQTTNSFKSVNFERSPLLKPFGFAHRPGTAEYWIGTIEGQVKVYDTLERKFVHDPAISRLPVEHYFASPFFDQQGNLWYEDWSDARPLIINYNYFNQQLRRFDLLPQVKNYHEIHHLMQQQDGRIWAAGSGVLATLEKGQNQFVLVQDDASKAIGISGADIACLFEDRERNVWIGTRNKGMFRCNAGRQQFTAIFPFRGAKPETPSGSVMSFWKLKDNKLLTGTWGSGPAIFNEQLVETSFTLPFTTGGTSPSIWNISASTNPDLLWLACQPGLYRYDQRRQKATFFDPPELQHKTIRAIKEDNAGNLWISVHKSGLFRWPAVHTSTTDAIEKVPGVDALMFPSIELDAHDKVWAGSSSNGIYVFDAKSGKLLKHLYRSNAAEKKLAGELVMDLIPYDKRYMLCGTGTGLYLIDITSFAITPLPLPFAPIGYITSMEKDAHGSIWFSTQNGLYCYKPGSGVMQFYNQSKGLADDRFVQNASYTANDGRMYFGTDNAFISFMPAPGIAEPTPQPVTITQLEAGNKPLQVDSILQLKKLTLSFSMNTLSVSFSPLVFSSEIMVQYKMEGLADEWQNADETMMLNFHYLPPGKYTLKLRAVNTDGKSSALTHLPIEIEPPFWNAWWFYVLLGVSTAGLIFYLDRLRTRRKESIQKIRSNIALGLHRQVNDALNSINILSEIARLKSVTEPEKAREFVEQIRNKSHTTIIAMDDMLWSLNPENDTMDKTILRIKEFTDALIQRSGAKIELVIDGRLYNLELDMQLRHEAFLLFKEGLQHIIDAGSRHCIVNLGLEKNQLLFTIELSNTGCDLTLLNALLQDRQMETRLNELSTGLHVQIHKSRSFIGLRIPVQ